ncbi:MAG TPA: methyltransferase domain-containing protein [Gammaproteobacteria bacterium]|nr:methyltransferase domain-containing protein [Gammaproteobacteria bacterium]
MTGSVRPAQPFEPWDAVAVGWSRWWSVFENAAQPVSERLVALAGVAPGHTVLDLATGLGEPALTAARRVGPRGRVLATDMAAAMLRGAAARAEAAGLRNIMFRAMDAERPDLPPDSFDAILCRWGLMFVPGLDEALRRLVTLLKPGGGFAAAAWATREEVPMIQISSAAVAACAPLPEDPPGTLDAFRFAEPERLAAPMRRAGLVEVSWEPLPLTFEFASADAYTQFRRDVTTLDSKLRQHHPPHLVEAAWEAVTQAARDRADADGRLCLVNTALCFTGRRMAPLVAR